MSAPRDRARGPSSDAPPHRPLAGLRALLGDRVASPRDPAPTAEPAPSPAAHLEQVLLAVERKGHGGKVVTRISGLGGDLDAEARELARALGTGARVEGEDVLVQGEHVDRLEAQYLRRGARQVVRCNR